MKKLTNYTPGPRGLTMKDGGVVWIKPGQTVEVDTDKVAVTPDLGDRPRAERDADAEALETITAERDALKKQVSALQADLEKATKPPSK